LKFIDEVTIFVKAGDGGRGCVSFRREKFIPKGGPDGGDGGKGGDVIVLTTSRRRTLHQFRYNKIFKVKNGGYGQGNNRAGKKSENLIIEVPPGTVIVNADTGETIKDCVNDGETFILAKGGIGGQGNARFATSTHRAPRFAQPGMPGEAFNLHLDLKLLADVGIIGFPNAGKSTLISRISSARPKVADYPFTTLTPNLGVVTPEWGEPFVVADTPGLIEGAHEGSGLGIKFLRHIERNRILLHLIDCSDIDPDDPLKAYRAINHELAGFSPALAEKKQIVVLNKMDMPDTETRAAAFIEAVGQKPVYLISSVTGKGVAALVKELNKIINGSEDNAINASSMEPEMDDDGSA
jgi:GTP-binding protein